MACTLASPPGCLVFLVAVEVAFSLPMGRAPAEVSPSAAGLGVVRSVLVFVLTILAAVCTERVTTDVPASGWVSLLRVVSAVGLYRRLLACYWVRKSGVTCCPRVLGRGRVDCEGTVVFVEPFVSFECFVLFLLAFLFSCQCDIVILILHF